MAVTIDGTTGVTTPGVVDTGNLSVTGSTSLATPLPVASGGTGGSATPTAGGIVYGTGTVQAVTSAGTAGQYLQSAGAGVPVWASLVTTPTIVRSARTSNTILGTADASTFIDITSGTFTQTFTAAATLGSGWFCYIRNSGTGDITLDPNASELIDGLTSYIMYPGEARLVQCNSTAFTSIVLTAFSKTFTTTATFTRPPGYYQFSGLLWAGGGSGGCGNSDRSGGGGGGACVPFTLSSTQIGASQTITIGAGGVSQTTAGSNGSAGGNSTIGSLVTSYGGGAGGGSSRCGGSGGGVLGAGLVGQTISVRVAGGAPFTGPVSNSGNENDWLDQSFGGGAAVTTTTAATNGKSTYGGGAGGASSVPAGASVYGGGGGGGVDNFGSPSTRGTSVFGGAGGNGVNTGTGGTGTTPSGGGGAIYSGNSGPGGDGQCIIYGIA